MEENKDIYGGPENSAEESVREMDYEYRIDIRSRLRYTAAAQDRRFENKEKGMKRAIWISLLLCGVAFAENFTIAVMPDPQVYTKYFPEILYSQSDWIAANQDTLNIQLVIDEGDNVHFGDTDDWQWERVDAAFSTFDDAQIPYLISVGNHDMGDNPTQFVTAYGRDTTKFNQYFPVSRNANKPWYGGHAENDNDNHYVLFEAGNVRFLAITLEFGPNDSQLDWANKVVAAYPDRFVIVVTHAYLGEDGYLLADDLGGVGHYQLPDANDGKQIWDKFVSLHDNIHLVLCGHIHGSSLEGCSYHQTSIGKNGNVVHEILSNFQSYMDEQSGFLRLLDFDVTHRTMRVYTYSPWLDQYITDDANDYELNVPLWQYRKQTTGTSSTGFGPVSLDSAKQ